jgi:hypothetical protein
MNSGAARRARTAYHRGGEVKTRLTIWLCHATVAAQNSPFPRRILCARYPIRRFKVPSLDYGRLFFLFPSPPEAKGSGTLKGALSILRIRRCGCGRKARPPAFRRSTAALSPGQSVPSPRRGPGQVSWEEAPTLRGFSASTTPTSSGAPRVPVLVPADVMPEPPGSAVYGCARRLRTRSASRNTFAKGVPRRARWPLVTQSVTSVNETVTHFRERQRAARRARSNHNPDI